MKSGGPTSSPSGHLVLIVVQLLYCGVQTSRSSDGRENYVGHKLLHIVPQNGHQVAILLDLLVNPPTHLKNLDFWNEPTGSLTSVDVRVAPSRLADLETYLRKVKLFYVISVDNIQRVIDDHAVQNDAKKTLWRLSVYDTYLNYDEIQEWLRDTVDRCGKQCTLFDIGRSYEGRPLYVIKITSSKPPETDTRPRPSVWIDAGIHAREWISHATALYFIDRLVSDSEFDSDVRGMLDAYDWYVMPCVNPDGYQYSHSTNRLWRKTRSKSQVSHCVGVDANRNFNFHWGSVGTSTDACSELYEGPSPMSEPEVAAVADFISARNGTWKLFLTLHSYGQMWMAPYGYSTDKPSNYNDLIVAATAARQAVLNVYGTEYTVGSASDVLYRSSGTSRDWAAGYAHIPYVYTVELRDGGKHGFLLPADQILPTGVETWEGVKALVRQINGQEDLKEIVDVELSDLLMNSRK